MTDACGCGFDDKRLISEETYQDHYAVLDELRETCRVHRSGVLNGWLLTRYADVEHCLRDPRTFSSAQNSKRKLDRVPEHLRERARPMAQSMDSRSLLMQDPPAHTAQRRVLSKAFLPAHIATLEQTVRDMTRSLLERKLGAGTMEFEADLARPLPGMVLAHFLGVPDSDREKFVRWGDAAVGISVAPQPTEEIVDTAVRAFQEMGEYVEGLLDQRRAHPETRDDFMALVTAAEGERAALSHAEVVGSCIQLLFAGHETSTTMLTLGLWQLLRHPDQLDLLRTNPSLIPHAVDEILRFESPVVMIPARTVMREVEVGGRQLAPGDGVFNLIGVANRDPRAFEQADVFDIARQPNRHLELGSGVHLCLGAPIARLEGRVVFEELLRLMPDVRLADGASPRFRPLLVLKKVEALPIAWGCAKQPADSPRAGALTTERSSGDVLTNSQERGT